MGWQKGIMCALVCLLAGSRCWLPSEPSAQEFPGTDLPSARELLDAGRKAHAENQLDRAIAAYGKAIGVAPQALALALRGRAHAQNGQDEAAWDDFQRALELDPQEKEAYAARAWLRAMRGEYEQGFADVNRAIELDPKFVDAYVTRAALYEYTSRLELARQDAELATSLDRSALDFRLPAGIFWGVARNDGRQIVKHCEDAVLGDQLNLATHMNLGFGHDLLQQSAQAVVAYTAALKLNPGYGQGYNYRGLAYLRQSENQRALEDFSKAIELDPGFKWPYVNRAECWMIQNQNDRALADLTDALKLDTKFNHALRNRMMLQFRMNHLEAAAADADALVAIRPEVPQHTGAGYMVRALCQVEVKRYAEAIADLDQAVRLQPREPWLYAIRAATYYRWGKIREAIVDDRMARSLDPRFGRDFRGPSNGEGQEVH